MEIKTLVIKYVHHVGGSFHDRKWWEGLLNGELYDYNRKEALIAEAEKNGWHWIVMKYSKKEGLIINYQKKIKMKVYKTNEGLAYKEYGYLIRLRPKKKGGFDYMVINSGDDDGEMYPKWSIQEHVSEDYLIEANMNFDFPEGVKALMEIAYNMGREGFGHHVTFKQQYNEKFNQP